MMPPPRKQEPEARPVHYAFARVGNYPPVRVPKRPAFRPELINAALFYVDSIRPYPEWPLICRQNNKMAFPDEKALKKWFGDMLSDSGQIWKCDTCGMFHSDPMPHEVSGGSSGKDIRKSYTHLAERLALPRDYTLEHITNHPQWERERKASLCYRRQEKPAHQPHLHEGQSS